MMKKLSDLMQQKLSDFSFNGFTGSISGGIKIDWKYCNITILRKSLCLHYTDYSDIFQKYFETSDVDYYSILIGLKEDFNHE